MNRRQRAFSLEKLSLGLEPFEMILVGRRENLLIWGPALTWLCSNWVPGNKATRL